MSEKLTVAELLARNGREASGDAGRRRRRSRNLEKGGISVAELTGSIPVVRDELLTDKPKDSAAKAEASKPGSQTQPEEKAPVAPAATSDPKAVTRLEEKPGERTGQLPKVHDEREENEAGKKSPAGVAAAGAAGAAAVAKPKSEPKTEPKAEPKGDSASGAKPGAEAGTGAGAKTGSESSPEVKTAEAEIPEAEATGAKTSRDKTPEAKTSEESDKSAKGVGGKKAAKKAGKREAPKELVGVTSAAEISELEANLDDNEVLEFEDDTISWPMMIAQAIGALVVGVGIFFGFTLLWTKAPAILALVLAIAVTLLLVGVVHALLRHRDKLLMLLAAIVGLVLTIGPRLIIGL